MIEDEYHFRLICNDFKFPRHQYVTNHLPQCDVTHSGFQPFINLMKTTVADVIRDVVCYINHAMINSRKKLLSQLI